VTHFVVPAGMGASRKLLHRLEVDESALLQKMQQLLLQWNERYPKARFVDLVLQRQGFSKLLWRSRFSVSGSQRFVDLFSSDLLQSLPSDVVENATEFEQLRVLLNADMKAVRGTRLSVESYLGGMRQLRAWQASQKNPVSLI